MTKQLRVLVTISWLTDERPSSEVERPSNEVTFTCPGGYLPVVGEVITWDDGDSMYTGMVYRRLFSYASTFAPVDVEVEHQVILVMRMVKRGGLSYYD